MKNRPVFQFFFFFFSGSYTKENGECQEKTARYEWPQRTARYARQGVIIKLSGRGQPIFAIWSFGNDGPSSARWYDIRGVL